jgi:hypothetical protein
MGKRSRRKNRDRKALGEKLGKLGQPKPILGARNDYAVFDELARITPESAERIRQRLQQWKVDPPILRDDIKPEPRSNHAQGLAQDYDAYAVSRRAASVDAKWAYDQYYKAKEYEQKQNAKLGGKPPIPRPISENLNQQQFKPWTQIDEETPDPEAEALSRVCIWCGITCESIEALEVHEETCE